MYDISILLPTIRTHLLEDLYESLCSSCHQHTFEFVCVGPFDIPQSLLEKDNVKYIKDYGQPTRCIQLALINSTGKLVHPLVDDCFYYPYTLSNTIDIFDCHCRQNDIIGMRFFENPEHYKAIKNRQTTEQHTQFRNECHPDIYWFAGPSYYYLKGINPNWCLACLFIANRDLIIRFGGWDCQFEYINHSTHDLLCRLQKNDSMFLLTQYDVFVANWYEGITMDHAPIHYGQGRDDPIFRNMWLYPNNRNIIDIDNWKNTSEIWTRRFGTNKPKTYKEMYGDETSSIS